MKSMSERIYTTQQIQSILQPVFMNHNIKKAILFGSYAKGIAKEQSDIDILVDSGLKVLLSSVCWKMLLHLLTRTLIFWMCLRLHLIPRSIMRYRKAE